MMQLKIIQNTMNSSQKKKYRKFLNVWKKVLNFTRKSQIQGFPGGAVVKNPPANAGDTGSSPGPGRSHMPRSN